jgi:uncharacterized membrane protein YfcA
MTTPLNIFIPSSRWRAFNLDALGFSASTLCAIHCAVTPLLLTALPLLGLNFLAHPAIETTMLVLSLLIGVASLAQGYFKHHQQWHALLLLAAGFAVIFAGHWVLPEADEEWFTPLGAGTVAIAHLVNWRLCRQCRLCND